VCLEDYDKGVCTPRVCREVIALCRRAGVPVLVDPAPIRDYAKYRGAAALTPNRTEAARAAGPGPGDDASAAEYGDMARRLRDELGLEAAIITLDRQGMVLAEQGAEPEVIPTVAREVYDVSGAGDMVLAALAGARANDVGWPDACRLANAAAGLEVAVFGVVPIPIERVHAEVLRRERGPGSKLRTLEELLVEAAALRREGRRLVFTNGCFDLLHAGHLALLQQAARHGDYLVVAINSDESVRRLKGPERPVRTERDRARLLGGLECVDAVVVFGDPTPERLIQALRPDVLVKGAEYALAEVPGAEFVIQSGGRVELLEMVQGVSTTGTIERIRAG
ncbi:MAG TPA: D-glycero-beta-D-manno-heptose 1-phosphate adenylyltransferase, partial [Phycisphaerales bacterium]|nr:D-glycero-beta-D-manno-heptose 1-phosphate adenylyltransferase [Phycisphaerales bacterium]